MHTTKEDTTIFWMKLNFEFFSLLKFKASESYTCILPPIHIVGRLLKQWYVPKDCQF